MQIKGTLNAAESVLSKLVHQDDMRTPSIVVDDVTVNINDGLVQFLDLASITSGTATITFENLKRGNLHSLIIKQHASSAKAISITNATESFDYDFTVIGLSALAIVEFYYDGVTLVCTTTQVSNVLDGTSTIKALSENAARILEEAKASSALESSLISNINNVVELRTLASTDLVDNQIILYRDTNSDLLFPVLSAFELEPFNGTDLDDSINIIIQNDYDLSTNNRIWKRALTDDSPHYDADPETLLSDINERYAVTLSGIATANGSLDIGTENIPFLDTETYSVIIANVQSQLLGSGKYTNLELTSAAGSATLSFRNLLTGASPLNAVVPSDVTADGITALQEITVSGSYKVLKLDFRKSTLFDNLTLANNIFITLDANAAVVPFKQIILPIANTDTYEVRFDSMFGVAYNGVVDKAELTFNFTSVSSTYCKVFVDDRDEGIGAVSRSYLDIPGLLGTNRFFLLQGEILRVDDASVDGYTGYVYYEYLGTDVGSIVDFQPIATEEGLTAGGYVPPAENLVTQIISVPASDELITVTQPLLDERTQYVADISGTESFIYTLPVAPTTNSIFRAKIDINSLGNGLLTINGNGITIDNSATISLTDPGEYVSMQYDGTEWVTLVRTASAPMYNTVLADGIAMPDAVGGFPGGTTVAEVKGKSIVYMWDTLLFPTADPYILAPVSATLLGITPITVEIGTTVNETVTALLNPGAINNGDDSAGPNLVGDATQFEFTNPDLSTSIVGATSNSEAHVAPAHIIEAGDNVWSVDIDYAIGSGLYYDSKGIASSVLDASRAASNIVKNSSILTGRYYAWDGKGVQNSAPTASAGVRALTEKRYLSFTNTGTFDISIPAATQEVYFYVPAGKTVKVEYVESSDADITSSFVSSAINVDDADGATVGYEKWVSYIGAGGYPSIATYHIIIS